MLQSYSMTFDGHLLNRGFWLYVWEIKGSMSHHVYVGRTGDSSSPHASSPFKRIGQHLNPSSKAKGNALSKQCGRPGSSTKSVGSRWSRSARSSQRRRLSRVTFRSGTRWPSWNEPSQKNCSGAGMWCWALTPALAPLTGRCWRKFWRCWIPNSQLSQGLMKACTRPPKNRAAGDARVIGPTTHLTTSSRSKVYSVSSFVLIHKILILSNCVILNFCAAPPGRIVNLCKVNSCS